MSPSTRLSTLRNRSRIIAAVAVCSLALVPYVRASAVAASIGTVEVSDTSPNVSPVVTFSYTLTVNRHGASGENFFMLSKPSGFPDLAAKNCTEIKALTTVKINGVTMDNETFIDTGVCSVWTGGVQLRLKAGIMLDIGDIVQITLASGVLVNPSSSSTTTWGWRTADYRGADSDWFTSTLLTGDASIMATSTTTTLPGATTSTTVAETTTTEPATTTTVTEESTTTTAPAEATTTTADLSSSSGVVEDRGSVGTSDGEDLVQSGADSGFGVALATLLVALGVLVGRRGRTTWW